jgi:hypothetical protein
MFKIVSSGLNFITLSLNLLSFCAFLQFLLTATQKRLVTFLKKQIHTYLTNIHNGETSATAHHTPYQDSQI